MSSELWTRTDRWPPACVPVTGRTDPIPIVVKYDVMGMGRMEMEVSLPGSSMTPLTDCLDLGESVGKKLKRICASEVKKNLLLNQHNKKRFLLKMHTLFTMGYLRSGWHPKLLSFLSFTSVKLWLLLAADGPAGSHQLGRISELFCMWVALWDDKTRKKKYNMQRFCFKPQFLNYTFCQSQ